jgi:Transglutaminase-like superfamily
MTQEELLALYRSPGLFTRLDGFEDEVEGLPHDVAVIARTVQGLLIQEGLIGAYGVSLPAERIAEKQLHSSVAILARAMSLDSQAIVNPRVPERRVVGVCRHFATLFVAIMRQKGVPARARCGFANYFAARKHVDHWVGEYWNAIEGRWVLVDAQIDDRQCELFRVTFDRLDVPRDRFLVAGDAWRACRNGADPMTFGVAGTEMWGLVEVYGDLFQDLAALQNIELLPWGWYGLATDKSGIGETALIDRLAGISTSANAQALDELRTMIAEDGRLRPPGDDALKAIVSRERAAASN